MPTWFSLIKMALPTLLSIPVVKLARVGYKEIVADKLHLLSQGPGQSVPAGPVFFAKAVFNADDRNAAQGCGSIRSALLLL